VGVADLSYSPLEINQRLKSQLSNDVGALSGLLFDVGVGKLVIDQNIAVVTERERKKRDKVQTKRIKDGESDRKEENEHTRMQYLLLKTGAALGCDVYAAANDHSKSCDGHSFSFLSLPDLPPLEVSPEVRQTIRLIDVTWLKKGSNEIVCAFEVEKSTSIYSGILRLSDLTLALPDAVSTMLYLVAPNAREKEVLAQLKRPALSANPAVEIFYLLFSDLSQHSESICKLGDDHRIIRKLAKCACCGSASDHLVSAVR